MKKLIIEMTDERFAGRRETLIEQLEGWFEGEHIAVDKDLKVCETYPWYADHMCTAPRHGFKVISLSEDKIEEKTSITYELIILHMMIEQLPDGPRRLLLTQLKKVVETFKLSNLVISRELLAKIKEAADDATLEVKALEFDLYATQKERDELRKKLNE